MARMLLELHVEMEDGATHDVVADQRDIARWEIQDFGCPFSEFDTRSMLAMRWLAWSALTRRGATTLPWPEFDAVCIEVADPEDEEAEGPDGSSGTVSAKSAPMRCVRMT